MVNGRLDVNVAATRSATQSSTYDNNGAWKAVDDKPSLTKLSEGSCSYTKPEMNPWLAVNGTPQAIAGVKITSLSNSYTEPNCKKTRLGHDYQGTLSVTWTGKTCQLWTSQSPHSHSYSTDSTLYPENSVTAASNYCRNPSNNTMGPWCYTTDPGTRWEFCNVRVCEGVQCTTTSLGADYTGTVNVTKSGRTCQAWTSQTPHSHSYNVDNMFPDNSVTDASNYCRNPDNKDGGLWCYTTDPSTPWEHCDLPVCEGSECIRSPQGQDYVGTLSQTISGRTCQSWSSQSPHAHVYTSASVYPEASVAEASNYCRNPSDYVGGPWCYTTDPAVEWELCNFPPCDPTPDNFVVGLTDVDPNSVTPTLWNYEVCGQYSDVVPPGTTVSLMCNGKSKSYRYLIVHVPGNRAFSVCELQVFLRRWNWSRQEGKRMINNVVSTFQVGRQLECTIHCTQSPTCDTYNYRPSDKTCQLNGHHPLQVNSSDIVDDINWTWWKPDYVNVV